MISWIVLHVEPRFSLFSWTHQKIFRHRLFEPRPRLKGSSNEDLGPIRRYTETLRIPLGTTRFKCYQLIVLLEWRFLTRERRSYESPSSLQTFTSPYEGAVVCSDAALPFIFYYVLDDLLLMDTKHTKIVSTLTSLALCEAHIKHNFLYWNQYNQGDLVYIWH